MKFTWFLTVLMVLHLDVLQAQTVPSESTGGKKGTGFLAMFKYNKTPSPHLTDTSLLFKKIEIKGVCEESNQIKNYIGSFGTNPDYANRDGILLKNINVTGIFRFVTIYRDMQDAYTGDNGLQTSKKNLSFLDYPIQDVSTSGAAGTPMLQLAMTSTINKNVDFRISYSIANSFSGSPNNKINKYFTSYGGIAFDGNLRTNAAIFNLKIGGLLTTRGSRLIFDAPRYRNNYFDRLLSNQFSVSGKESNEGVKDDGKFYLSPYVRGVITRLTFPGLQNLYLSTMVGRTSNTAAGVLDTVSVFPALNYMLRVGRPFAIRSTKGNIALNYLGRDGNVDNMMGAVDNAAFQALDFDLDFKKLVKVSTEFGLSTINNPLMKNSQNGTAFITNLQFKNLLNFPLSIEYYAINNNYANLDAGILNTNTAARNGGSTTPGLKDLGSFVNVAQECGQVTNNRKGLDVASTLKFGDLTVDLGYAFSQELENKYDTILIQHRVNAFSRSRFYYNGNGVGPYNRIRSIYARTFEMIKVTDTDKNYKKGFNNMEALLKYNINIAGKKLMLFNYNNFVSIQDHFSLTPIFSDQAFVRTFYEDFTIAFQLYQRFSLIGNYGYERVIGNTRVTLSPDKESAAAGDRIINQTGSAIGYGFNYDITSRFGINYRHKWMTHHDKNFLQDHFKGQEFTLEFKMLI